MYIFVSATESYSLAFTFRTSGSNILNVENLLFMAKLLLWIYDTTVYYRKECDRRDNDNGYENVHVDCDSCNSDGANDSGKTNDMIMTMETVEIVVIMIIIIVTPETIILFSVLCNYAYQFSFLYKWSFHHKMLWRIPECERHLRSVFRLWFYVHLPPVKVCY